MACANQRNVLLPLEKGAFYNHVLRMVLRESVFDCPVFKHHYYSVSPICISHGPSVIPE